MIEVVSSAAESEGERGAAPRGGETLYEDKSKGDEEEEERFRCYHHHHQEEEEERQQKRQHPQPNHFQLPEESDVEETSDILPSHVNLAGNVPDYVRESDDFQLVSRWVSGLPRSGRSLYERAVRDEISPFSNFRRNNLHLLRRGRNGNRSDRNRYLRTCSGLDHRDGTPVEGEGNHDEAGKAEEFQKFFPVNSPAASRNTGKRSVKTGIHQKERMGRSPRSVWRAASLPRDINHTVRCLSGSRIADTSRNTCNDRALCEQCS